MDGRADQTQTVEGPKYQGHANWSTWNIGLWIMNEESIYRDMVPGRPYTAESAKAFCLEYFPNGTPDMDHGEELGCVDWNEIAASFNEE